MSNYPLRLPDHVMSEAKRLAEADGASLNQFLTSIISEKVGELKGLRAVQSRIARADREAALNILAKVPSAPPEPGDELPA
jgi:hypothetical protein